MKITKDYLKQVIKEEYNAMQEAEPAKTPLSDVKQKLIKVLSQRARGGMDVELLVHMLTDEEAASLLDKNTKPSVAV